MSNPNFDQPISEYVWENKYRLRDIDGTPIDKTPNDTWRRVAKALASAESSETSKTVWEEHFFQIMASGKFSPAGRIIAGAGTDRRVTLSNCYTMGTIPDSLDGIFTHLKEAALTMQQGGGIGYDFSTLRPKGALVKKVGADASGPLSFMDVWDAMCRTIMSAGQRRGAMMATMRCDHPDIVDFIEAKRDKTRLRNFNLSVLVTDGFMSAVRDDTDWRLHFENRHGKTLIEKTIKARDLWDKIMRSTYDYAEPGVIFIDRVNKAHNLNYLETVATTNPSMPAGTKVHTRDGIFPIETLEGKKFEVKSLDGKWSPAHCFLSSEDAEILEIDFGGGKTVRCTPEHRWPVESNGRYLKSDTSDLRAGDRVPLCRNESLGLQNGTLCYDDGVACGLILGDGSYGERVDDGRAYLSVSVNKDDTDIRDFLCSYLNCNFSERESEFQVQLCRDKDVRNVIDRLGLSLHGEKARLPEKAWTSNDGFIAGLVSGLFGSDGHVHTKNRCLVLTSKTREFIREVGLLLAFHGVNCTFRESQNGDFSRTDLVVTFASLKRFNKVFTIWCDRKRAALASFIDDDARDHVSSTNQVVQSVVPVGRARVWDIAVDHDQHVFPSEWAYTGNCGEKPMGPYASCLLGSINLTKFILEPFGNKPFLYVEDLRSVVRTAIRLMDNVVDVGNYPLEAQKLKAKADRQLGLGVTGLADALIMHGLKYGSDGAVAFTRRVMQIIAEEAYETSIKLAAEKGSFSTFDAKQYLSSTTFAGSMMRQFHEAILAHGIRNSLLLSIAPTGTISLFAGNVSSGIEPVFAASYERKVKQPDGSFITETVEDYAVRAWRTISGDKTLPPAYVDAQTLTPYDHIKMQAAAQDWVDSSISKTVNVPVDIDFEAFKQVYRYAYTMGCKGCTTYRPNDITGSILSITPEPQKAPTEAETPAPGTTTTPEPLAALSQRPAELTGVTYKLKWPGSEHALYITVSDIEENGVRRPFEIFINSKNMEHFAWTVALTRMISAVFRRGGPIDFVAEELKAVFDPRGGAWMDGKYVPSILAAIGNIVQQHVKGGTQSASAPTTPGTTQTSAPTQPGKAPMLCPACSSDNLKVESGCVVCKDCGYSKCN